MGAVYLIPKSKGAMNPKKLTTTALYYNFEI